MTGVNWQRIPAWAALAVILGAGGFSIQADEPKKPDEKPAAKSADTQATPTGSSSQKPFAVLLKDATLVPGLITLHQKEGKVYAELPNSLLGKEFFVSI